MPPLIAQAAVAVTNTPAPTFALTPPTTLVERVSEMTGLPPTVVLWSSVIVEALVVLVVGYWVANLSRRAIARLCDKRHLDLTVSAFVGNLVHAAAMVFVLVTALSVIGVPTTTFSAVIAAACLAIGLALQGSLSNFAAGFLLVVFRPFKKGDAITAAGTEGIVEEISIFSTTLTTPDNKRIIVPNSALMGGNITNHTANNSRRVDLQFSVGAGQDLNKAHATLLEVAKADARVFKEPPPTVANTKLIDLGVQVELRAWCKTADWAGLGSDLIAKAPSALAEAGIKGPDKTIPYREIK